SMKTHFDVVGPRNGDKASQEQLIVSQGATGTVDILQQFTNEGQFHVRGWKLNTRTEKKVSVTTVVVDTTARVDQFMLEDGKAYLYSSHFVEEGKGIFETDMLSAGIEVNGAAYLINVTHVVADNKGFSQVAVSEVKKTAD